jgi:hypothetical protein
MRRFQVKHTQKMLFSYFQTIWRGSDLILNEEELKKNVIMTLDPSIHHLFSLEREAKV